jgi:leucyl aminopeptidase
MKITRTEENAPQIAGDGLVIGVWKDQPLAGQAQLVDRASNGLITRLVDSGDISSGYCKTTLLLSVPGVAAPTVCVVGLGERAKADTALSYRAAAAGSRALAARQRERVAFCLEVPDFSDAVAGSMTGCVGQDLYRKEKSLHPFSGIIWRCDDMQAVSRGDILGRAIDRTRTLVNEPANKIYPESFANVCVEVGKQAGFDVEVWDEKRLEQERCGSLLAVARGSARPPRIVIMRYHGGGNNKPLAFVGKGVTFDSGGLSLKPNEFMLTMKCDMAGAATVVGAMQAIAELRLPVNMIGLVGLVENMVSGNAYRLGDVLTARNGTTIEVHNTDAEGRLVLADVLDVAVSSGAERIIDLATLTGACMVALGNNIAGLMGNNDSWLNTVRQASIDRGETAWPLPMLPEFDEMILSKVADIKNVGEGRAGGAITAAKLLQRFVDELPWVHVDIAGPAFADKPSAWGDAGATGYFVRTLVDVAGQTAS